MNNHSKLKTIISVLLVAVFIVIIVYVNNPSEPIQEVYTETESPKVTDQNFQQDRQNGSAQLFSGTLLPDSDSNQTKIISQEASSQSERCKQEKERLDEQRTDLTVYALSEEEANNLVMLSGLDWNSGIDLKSLTEEERRQWRNDRTERQLSLLKEQHANDTDPLVAQLYLERCAVNDKPDLCPPEILQTIAEENSDNLAGWLSLLQYYSNRNAPDKMEEIISRAADSTFVDAYEYEFTQRLYRDYLQIYNSPRLALLAVYNALNARATPLWSISSYCNSNDNADCYKIGETLENNGNTISAKLLGLSIQENYLGKSQQESLLPEVKERILDLSMAVKTYIQPFRILLDDQMAVYMIDALYIRDELEYYQTISSEAERLLAENPDICVW